LSHTHSLTHTLLSLSHIHVARWLSCLHCHLTAKRSWVRFPHGALLVLGAGSPQAFGAQVGLSVWSLCSPRVHKGFLHKEPQQKKHAKEQNTLRRSLTKTDGS